MRTRPLALKLCQSERRQALRLGIVNGLLWSMGNGLTTGTLVVYLAQELGARGRQVGLILAMQSLVGVLRIAAPGLIRRLGGVKSAAIGLLSAAYVLLCALPAVGLPGFSDAGRLRFFIGLLAVHQLLESLGTVALWAWLGHLVPPRLRGRYFAVRQRWQLVALIPALTAAGAFADWWRGLSPHFESSTAALAGYTVPLGVGALVLLSSVVPLWWMPAVAAESKPRLPRAGWPGRARLAVLAERRFRRLLLFGCWFSFSNGILQSATGIYPKRVLGLGVTAMLLLPLGMRLGQIALAPYVGRFSDRWGNRPVIFGCQALIAQAPLFFLLATPAAPWWLAGAFALYSAYVGLNVCLPSLTLKLSTGGNYAVYMATYFAVSGVAYGVATLLGGWLLDLFAFSTFRIGRWQFDNFGYLFYIGWTMRMLSLLLVLALAEPDAWTWRQILTGRREPLERQRQALAPEAE